MDIVRCCGIPDAQISYSFVPATNHSSLMNASEQHSLCSIGTTHHTESHSFVAVHKIAQKLAGGGDRYPFTVPQFVETTVHSEIGFPILTVSYSIVTIHVQGG